MSFDELCLFNDEYDNDGSISRSPGTRAFPFLSGKTVGSAGESVGSVSGVGSVHFVPILIESVGDFFRCLSFYQEESSPNVVDS